MIKVHLTTNVTLSAVAGIFSIASVSGMGSEITPPMCGSVRGEISALSVSPDR